MNKRLFILLMLMAFLLSIYPSAMVHAHSPIERRSPSVSEVLTAAPEKIELYFEDPVEVHRESIRLIHEDGGSILALPAQLDQDDAHHVSAEITGEMKPGTYNVEISVVALDGHPLTESYSFVVKAPERTDEERFEHLRLEAILPEDGTLQQTSPKTIELWYSEDVEMEVFGVLNDRQKSVPVNQPIQDPKDPEHWIVQLEQPLPKGTYSVHAQVRIGEFQKYDIKYFAIEEVTSIVGSSPDDESNLFQNLNLTSITHWLAYIGLLALGGVAWFERFTASNASQRWRRLQPYVYIVTGLSIALELLVARFTYSGVAWADFFSFLFVRVLFLQLLFLALSFVLYRFLTLRFILLICGLMGWVLSGHSVVPDNGGIWAVAFDTIHVLSASIWFGGLGSLLLLASKENDSEELLQGAARFSPWALGSVIALGISGTAMSLLYVRNFTSHSLWASDWGKLLIVKVSVFVVLIVIGVWQRGLLRKWSHEVRNRFRRNTLGEIGLLVVLLLMTSMLVDVSPNEARQGVQSRPGGSELIEQVVVTPLKPGANDIIVRLKEGAAVGEVNVEISSSSGWVNAYRAFQVDAQTYKVTGNLFHSPGTITMDVLLDSNEPESSKTSYVVFVPGPME